MARRRVSFVFVLVFVLGAVACSRGPLVGPSDLAPRADLAAVADLALPSCRVDKIAFTQATGCQNDGSVEFCIPKDAPAVRAQLEALSTLIQCAPGGGRAMCDSTAELLCSLPTGMAECQSPHGALTDDAWQKVCAIAALPEVRKIVPTIFE